MNETPTIPTVAIQTIAVGSPAWLDREAYPFRSRWLGTSSGRVHYVDEGEGDPIVFVHGTPSWSFEYRHLIRALSTTHRCIALDHLGFGLSERPRDFVYTPSAHARVLAEFVERLGLERFTLVVHDFGGPIGLPLALDDSRRVERLVLMNTWMWSLADDRAMVRAARLAGSTLGRWLYRYLNFSLRVIMPSAFGDKTRLTRELHAQYLAPFADRASRGTVLWTLARSLLGESDYYASLWERRAALQRIPVQIVWGLKDSAFGPRFFDRWRNALPDAAMVTLPDAGHWPHEERPGDVVGAVREFLERGGPR